MSPGMLRVVSVNYMLVSAVTVFILADDAILLEKESMTDFFHILN